MAFGEAVGVRFRPACRRRPALGATWDPRLVRLIGEVLGDEALDKGARVLLAPTVNIHRHPVGGRNFECFSEDPLLSAAMAVAYVQGVQSRGVGCAIKHFACNDQELERMSIDVEVDERPFREIYLAPFEAAVREAGVCMVMSAYNKLRGAVLQREPGPARRACSKRSGASRASWCPTGSGRTAPRRSAPDWTSRCQVPRPSSARTWSTAVAQGLVRAATVHDAADRVLSPATARLRPRSRHAAPPTNGPHWHARPLRRASCC